MATNKEKAAVKPKEVKKKESKSKKQDASTLGTGLPHPPNVPIKP